MLNEMVQIRPNTPYTWLAHRMRFDACHSPAAGTLPVVPAAAKSALGSELEKSWGFVLGLQAPGVGGAPAAKPVKGAAKAAKGAAAGDGLKLTIEPQGKGLLLAIRAV